MHAPNPGFEATTTRLQYLQNHQAQVRELTTQHQYNLGVLRRQAAQFGIAVPLHIQNGIRHEEEQLRQVEQELERVEREIDRVLRESAPESPSSEEPLYSCFISYSSKDQEFAERLHADLQSKGVRSWFAPKDMRIGDRIRPSIDKAIRLYDKLLLILSQHSIESDWVEAEVETALEEERLWKRTVLFPIRMDDGVVETDQAWAAHIRQTRHIGDFRDWRDPDAYQQAFARLLRHLEVENAETEK